MTYSIEQLTTPYERFSNRVPYFPQAVLIVVLSAISAWLTFNVGRLFVEYSAAALTEFPLIHGDHWARLWQSSFFSRVQEILLHLGGMVAIAFAIRWMPMYHESFRNPNPNPVLNACDNVWVFIGKATAILHFIAFGLWCLVAGLVIAGIVMIPMIMNIFLVPPMALIFAAAHFYVLYSGSRTFLAS